MEMGYNTSAYFTAAFHRETGATPSEFRRQFRAVGKPTGENGHGDEIASG
jgi:AraC-like DNA-binding protein